MSDKTNAKKEDELKKPFHDIEWNSFKLAIKGFLIICMIILMVSLISAFANAITRDYDFNFYNEIHYISSNNNKTIGYEDKFNIGNKTNVYDIFPSVMNFTGETEDQTPSNWNVVDKSAGSIKIVGDYYGHDLALRFIDSSSGDILDANSSIEDATSGTIEYWVFLNDTSERIILELWDNSTKTRFNRIRCDGGNLEEWVGGSWHDYGEDWIENAWNHISIAFRTFSGASYRGLNYDSYRTQINNVTDGGQHVGTTVSQIDTIRVLTTSSATVDLEAVIDDLGWDWSSYYDIGDNWINYQTNNATQQIDKDEFCFEGVNDLYDVGDDNPLEWVETDVSDEINIVNNGSYDRAVNWDCSIATNRTIERTFTGSNANFYKISFKIWFDDIGTIAQTSKLYFQMFSNDSSMLINIRGRCDGFFSDWIEYQYYDGASWNTLGGPSDTDAYSEFTFYINTYSPIVYVVQNITGSITFVWEDYIPLLTYGKVGLGSLKFNSELGAGVTLDATLDNVGIYEYGESLATDFGYWSIDLNQKFWDWEEYNLVYFRGSGDLRLHRTYSSLDFDLPYQPGITNLDTIAKWHTYDNTTKILNLYDDQIILRTTYNQRFVVYANGTDLGLYFLRIEGLYVNETYSGTLYPLVYKHGGINFNTSLFYMINGTDTLRWNYTSDGSNEEYIEAGIDFPDISSVNASVQCRGMHNGTTYAYFKVNFLTGSTFYELYPYISNIANVLPGDLFIDNWTILVTDLDSDRNGTAHGFITDIEFFFYPNYSLSITTTNLLTVFVPLILILIPTLALAKRYGKWIIVPGLIAFTIIAYIGNLIPTWLLFVVLAGLGTILFTQFARTRTGGGETEI